MKRNEIEKQEVIGEAREGSYKPIRFTRVWYKNSPSPTIDIRAFQRGYDKEGEEVWFPTKNGFQFLESEFARVVRNWTVMPSAYVHPEVMKQSFDLLAKGQFESAVLQAFKLVEVQVRKKAKLGKDDHGTNLFRKAFDPRSGVLTDMSLPVAEREAMSHFVAGSYGLYRNACSHRDVKMQFNEAFEQVVVASTILKLVERCSESKTS